MSRKQCFRLFLLIISVLIVNSPALPEGRDCLLQYMVGETGLTGAVFDEQTCMPLPARLVLRNENGECIESYYRNYPGYYTTEDGTFHFHLLPGEYTLDVYHGFEYLSQSHKLYIKQDHILKISIKLQPWLAMRKMGWVNGDGHAHLYTEKQSDEEMLIRVRRICHAQGVDFISANQGWAGYNDNNWREGYARFSNDHFLLHYGAEMPKYRTGHTWWLGLESCRGYFEAAMDTCYENRYYQSSSGTSWDFYSLPLVNIPDVELVARFKKEEDAVACIPHPTSWWWQRRGNIEKYTTNICSYLSFGLLAGGIWDGLVVMGYEKDHYYYQNLWFNVLNRGYRMTPVAELDGGYGPDNKFPYGTMRVYYQVGDTLTMDRVVRAVWQGRTMVTSGPVIFTDIDNIYQVGDELVADSAAHTLHIDAFAASDVNDYLSYLVIFRNGQIHKMWDLRVQKLRHYQVEMAIQENEQAWYVIKAYGRKSWENPENLDVMSVCRKIEQGVFKGADNNEHDICLTGPYYFRPAGGSAPAALESSVAITLVHPVTGKALPQAVIQVYLDGIVIASHTVKDGRTQFTMPCNAILKISAPGLAPITRCLYLDYEPQQKILETLANGNWLEQNNWRNTMHPGQVPWEAFQFEKTKEILANVEWKIEMQPNERDRLWNDFEALFK